MSIEKPQSILQLIIGPVFDDIDNLLLQKTLIDESFEILIVGIIENRDGKIHFHDFDRTVAFAKQIQKKINKTVAIEILDKGQIKAATSVGFDTFYIGQATSINPFTMQEISGEITVSKRLIVANPNISNCESWVGAIERVEKVGINQVQAVYFPNSFGYGSGTYQIPIWEIPIMLKKEKNIKTIFNLTTIDVAYDMSETALQIIEANFDGIMVSPDYYATHYSPFIHQYLELMTKITKHNKEYIAQLKLSSYRRLIDLYDNIIVNTVAERMRVCKAVGELKHQNGLPILQESRWENICSQLKEQASIRNMSAEFLISIFALIHSESVKLQTSKQLSTNI